MNVIKSFLLFNESLLPSQFREYVKMFDKTKYEKIFKDFSGDHDRNFYRLFIPIEKKKSKTHIKIEKYLSELGYEIVDYIQGKARYKDAKNTTRINQILTRLKEDTAKVLSKLFVEDPDRKAGEDLMVCISRHPYDIAGSDTDRNWSNCLTMARNDTKRYVNHINNIKKELELVDLKELSNNIDEIIDNENIYDVEKVDCQIIDEMDEEEANIVRSEMVRNGIIVGDELLVKYEDEDGLVETDNFEFNKMASKYNSIIKMIEDIANYVVSGNNIRYIERHISAGVLMTYLVRKSDKNINDPIANLDIKPYYNVFNTEDTILVSDTRMYGHGTSDYKNTVDNWLSNVNRGKYGVYRLYDGIYNDNLQNKTILVKEDGSLIVTDSNTDYKLDNRSINIFRNKINGMNANDAELYIQYIYKNVKDMKSCGSLMSDILSVIPEKWKIYFNND